MQLVMVGSTPGRHSECRWRWLRKLRLRFSRLLVASWLLWDARWWWPVRRSVGLLLSPRRVLPI